MNKSLSAFLSRGFDLKLANALIADNYTLNSLKSLSKITLLDLGLTDKQIDALFAEKRPPIPEDIINRLLHRSRWTCCICRDSRKSIIVHHILPWKDSRSNDEENLVILCIEHHDLAHTQKELSQNLTPDHIRYSKDVWQKEVERLDAEVLAARFKELNVIPIRLSNLKKRWFNFFKKLGWEIQIVNDPFSKFKYDFYLHGKKELYFKVYEIADISELVQNHILIKEYTGESFFDNLIILGNGPFLSNNGFYKNNLNIQIGWVFSHGEGDWDHVMLKEDFDISNSIFFIENMIYDRVSYKNYLLAEEWPVIEHYWNEAGDE